MPDIEVQKPAMISITPIDAADLRRHFATAHTESEIPKSFWKGEGSQHFLLYAPVRYQQLDSVMNGYTPDGTVMLLDQSDRQRGPNGWQIRVAAPETVNSLWAVAPSQFRSQIEASHLAGVQRSLYEFERSLRSDDPSLGESRRPGLVMVVIPSEAARSEVPVIRTDIYLANLWTPFHGPTRRCPFGTEELQGRAKATAAVYHATLGDFLNSRMGLELQTDPAGEPKVIGVPEKLDFSKSSSEVNRRPLSRLVFSAEALRLQEWNSRAERQGWGRSKAAALLRHGQRRRLAWEACEAKEKRNSPEQDKTEPKVIRKTLFGRTIQTHSY